MMLRRFALPPLQKLLYGLFVCFCLACGIELLRRGLPGYLAVDWANCHEGDWLADWRGAQLFRIGMSPFTQEGLNAMGHANNPFGHAPPAPFVFLPFTDLPKALVAEFAALSGLMLLPIHIYLTTKELKFPAPLPPRQPPLPLPLRAPRLPPPPPARPPGGPPPPPPPPPPRRRRGGAGGEGGQGTSAPW